MHSDGVCMRYRKSESVSILKAAFGRRGIAKLF